MDGEVLSQETTGSTETAGQSGSNNNNDQTEESELGEHKDEGAEPPAGETAEGHGVKEVGVEDTSAGDTDKPQVTPSKRDGGEAEEAGSDEDSAGADVKNAKETSGQKDEGQEQETEKAGPVEADVKDGEEMKGKKDEKERSNMEEKENAVGKGVEKEKHGKEVETKEKEKMNESEKQGKPKRRSGPPSSSVSRPKPSARSIRASARNELIAKFQRGAPETAVPRNFKIQKSASASAAGASIKQKILHWCHNKTRNYEGVNIENFSSSWCDGLAFCALIHRFFPEAFDYNSLDPKNRRKNLTLAFQSAESLVDCYPLLEVDDMLMMGNNPDPMCVFTYVQALCHSLSKIDNERREKPKEEKDTAGDKGGASGSDGAGELPSEKDEGESDKKGTRESQDREQEDAAETEGTKEEDMCETEGGVMVEAES
ncbi:smoothelin-like 1 [Brachionichthys hirsutus]|uniref:smoothelin-like 1 n=1 Tax=Brachionichthys hirsutus TaxID=412623 RepID=UPI003604DAA8